jgi:hypothetical protein
MMCIAVLRPELGSTRRLTRGHSNRAVFEEAGSGGHPGVAADELGGSRESWCEVIPPLAPDRRVIAVDLGVLAAGSIRVSASASDNSRSSHYRYRQSQTEGCRVRPSPAKTPTPALLDSPPDEQRVLSA